MSQMRLRNVKPRDLDRAIQDKVKPQERRASKEVNYWYCLDGKRLFRITKPKVHSGGSVPIGTLNQIRQNLKLSADQFSDLVNCPMSGAAYEALIRQKVQDGRL